MLEFNIFTLIVCTIGLVSAGILHWRYTLRPVRWKEDTYRLFELRDELLLSRIQQKIPDDDVFDLLYDLINLGIAASKTPKVSFFSNVILIGQKKASQSYVQLLTELKTNKVLAEILFKYVEIVFVEIVYRRSLILRLSLGFLKLLRMAGLVTVIRLATRFLNFLGGSFKRQRDVYKAYQWFDDLKTT